MFRYGAAIGDPRLRAMGASGVTEDDVDLDDRSIGRTLLTVFGWEAMAADRGAAPPLPRDAWLPSDDMQLMAARDREGSTDGLYLAAWGSHNAQSHNHNDVGNAIVFVDGAPVLVDVGRPTYTAQTFSSTRYDIWAMQSAYPQPADGQRPDAEGRRRLPREGRCLPGGGRVGGAHDGHRAGLPGRGRHQGSGSGPRNSSADGRWCCRTRSR